MIVVSCELSNYESFLKKYPIKWNSKFKTTVLTYVVIINENLAIGALNNSHHYWIYYLAC